MEVNNDEVEVERSRFGFGFRSVSTLNERPVLLYISNFAYFLFLLFNGGIPYFVEASAKLMFHAPDTAQLCLQKNPSSVQIDDYVTTIN